MVANNVINCQKLHPDSIIPTRNNEYDAGADLYAKEDVLLPSIPKIIMGWLWKYTYDAWYSRIANKEIPSFAGKIKQVYLLRFQMVKLV